MPSRKQIEMCKQVEGGQKKVDFCLCKTSFYMLSPIFICSKLSA